MLRYSLVYGGIAGFITIVVMLGVMTASGGEGVGMSQWLGYLVMLLALSLIYFGTRRYRDIDQGGVISFKKALGLGVGIAIVASLIYVLVWEIYLAFTGSAFIETYTAAMIAEAENAGASAEELAAKRDEMAAMVEQYANPFIRLPITFSEIFPVGFLVALVSAGLLRTRGPAARA
jgi:hypothetical protein